MITNSPVCPRCHCREIYRARRRPFDFPLLALGFLAARCQGCSRRFYCLRRVYAVRPRLAMRLEH